MVARAIFCTFVVTVLSVFGFTQVPHSSHVWVVTEENHSYENVMASMPYLVSLANQYGLATQYYSDMHNSISALMHLTAGQTVTTNDNTTATFDVDNIVRRMLPKGLTFRSYQEELPYAGYSGISYNDYVKRHNPLVYFTDVSNSSLKYHSVPYTQLSSDLSNHATGNYNYITPDLLDDAHDGTMGAADYWLKQHLPAILAQPEFQSGGDGLLFIVFDEGNLYTDNRCSATVSSGCGGRVATVVIGPKIRRGYRSTVWHNHESLLKTVCLALGTSGCPGAASTASPMLEYFAGVQMKSPSSGSTITGGVPVSAYAVPLYSAHPITAMRIYVDNQNKLTASASSISANLALATGTHKIVVVAWDSTGRSYTGAATYVTVQ